MSGSNVLPPPFGVRRPLRRCSPKLLKKLFCCSISRLILFVNRLLPDNMLTIADVIEALTSFRPPNAEAVITEGVIDSRQVIPASLFIAIPGEKVDGHDYIQDAFRKG